MIKECQQLFYGIFIFCCTGLVHTKYITIKTICQTFLIKILKKLKKYVLSLYIGNYVRLVEKNTRWTQLIKSQLLVSKLCKRYVQIVSFRGEWNIIAYYVLRSGGDIFIHFLFLPKKSSGNCSITVPKTFISTIKYFISTLKFKKINQKILINRKLNRK